MLNNYFTTTTGSNCINPRKNSEFLIEGNYFAISASKSYGQSGAKAVTWRTNNYFASGSTPSSFGTTVTVPYDYTVADVQAIPSVVSENVGATLFTATGIIVPFAAPANTTVYNLSGQRVTKVGRGLYIVDGKKIVVR